MTANDPDLLSQFTHQNSQPAFAALVARHLNLVYSAALRQVRSPQLAEEVAQSVFTDLARNAGQLKPGTILTAWLYQVARRTAIDVVRREARRQLREQIATEMNAMNATTDDWAHVAPLLDEAMHALDDTDRAAVLLRYFENKSLREVGATLGTSDDAAQKRVSRAVERLREFFTKRGVTIAAGGLVVVISTNAVQAAPAGLAVAISAVAVAGTTLAITTTSTVTKAIAMTTLQKALITTVLAATAGFGILEARQNSGFRDQIHTLRQQQSDELQQLERERNDDAGKLAALQAENARLNQSAGELLRLRAEVGRLSKEADELAKQRQALAREKSPATDPTTNSPPFQTFSAKMRVNVPWDQAVITGGWKLPSGKRGIVIISPTCIDAGGRHLNQPETPGEGQLVIQTKIFGLSEEAARQLGLDKFNTDDQDVTSSSLLAADEYGALTKAIEQSDGAEVLAAPSVVTESGREARLQVTDNQTSPGGENHAPGPVVDYIPTISADGRSVDMQIVANVNYPTAPPVK